jgi:hypothetical protein
MKSLLPSVFALLLFCGWGVAEAHKASTSYLHAHSEGATLEVRWDIAIRDLDYALGLDKDASGDVTWGELKQAATDIERYALERIKVSRGGGCTLRPSDLKVVAHSDGAYAVLFFTGSCPVSLVPLRIDYSLLFDLDALHRGLAVVEIARDGKLESRQSVIFTPDSRSFEFAAGEGAGGRVFTQYFEAGLLHVWSGLDHMLFLAGLFLPAVLRREQGRWRAVNNLSTAVRDTAWIVTAFTLAHACTLTLAATGAFTLPARWVESAVALTVLFAGFNNLVPLVYRELFWLSAVFGLIHGAAVASALIDLGLPATGRVLSLLAFNLGVEAAQLSLLVAVVLPAFLARHTTVYRRFVLVPGSAVVALIGACWFVERSLNVYFGVPLP